MDRNRIDRTFIVGPERMCDFPTIQEAINAAHATAPAVDKQYQVIVMPGVYRESLKLFDYVNIKGYGSANSIRLEYAYGGVISQAATCQVENLTIGPTSDDAAPRTAERVSPAVTAGVSGAVLVMRHILFGSEFAPGQMFLNLTLGRVDLEHCVVWGGYYEEPLIKQSGDCDLNVMRCKLVTKTDTSLTRPVVLVEGANSDVNMHYSRLEAQASSNIYALQLTGTPTWVHFLHCNFRSANGVAAIANTSGGSRAATFGHCSVNVARTGTWSGLGDFVVNTGA